MKPELAASFVAALLFHALVLFGFRLETAARPLAMTDDENAPVDVRLVEAPPAAAAPTPASTPEPPEPQPTPEETPTPPPDMPAAAPMPQEDMIPSPESTPAPPHPKPVTRHLQQKHSAPHSAPGSAAALAGAASHGAATGPLSSHARYLSNPRPDYPQEARQMHQQGVVELNVLVGADGRASEVSVSRSSGFSTLDAAAVEAVRRWIFEPARAGGLPVPSRVEVPVRFSLSN